MTELHHSEIEKTTLRIRSELHAFLENRSDLPQSTLLDTRMHDVTALVLEANHQKAIDHWVLNNRNKINSVISDIIHAEEELQNLKFFENIRLINPSYGWKSPKYHWSQRNPLDSRFMFCTPFTSDEDIEYRRSNSLGQKMLLSTAIKIFETFAKSSLIDNFLDKLFNDEALRKAGFSLSRSSRENIHRPVNRASHLLHNKHASILNLESWDFTYTELHNCKEFDDDPAQWAQKDGEFQVQFIFFGDKNRIRQLLHERLTLS